MSRRVVETLYEFTSEIEVYSIDEAFLQLQADQSSELTELGRRIRRLVWKWTGIPVTVGIAPTKTLAKVAALIAKESRKAGGVVNLVDSPYVNQALRMTRVENVWGIGPAYARHLQRAGITTALALRSAPDGWVRRQMSLVGLRIVHELRGVSCLPFEFCPPSKKSITRANAS